MKHRAVRIGVPIVLCLVLSGAGVSGTLQMAPRMTGKPATTVTCPATMTMSINAVAEPALTGDWHASLAQTLYFIPDQDPVRAGYLHCDYVMTNHVGKGVSEPFLAMNGYGPRVSLIQPLNGRHCTVRADGGTFDCTGP